MSKFQMLNHGLVKNLMYPESIRPIVMSDLISYCEQYTLDGPYIGDQLDPAITTWDSLHPVVIKGNTGCGKTTAIKEKIIRPSVKGRYNVLIIINRVSLNLAYKKEIARLVGVDKMYTDEGLMSAEEFGNVYIVNYQGLEAFLQRKKDLTFRYVIADECHYFLQDSSFSDCTGSALDMIAKTFSQSIRIYISATIDEVLPFIIKAELWEYEVDPQGTIRSKNMCMHRDLPLPKIYKVQGGFDRVSINFFDNPEQLLAFLKTRSTKSMLFCDSVNQCEEVCRALPDSLVLTSAKFHTQPERYTQLIEKEFFTEKHLVSTSVFSNGNNIKDTAVKDVVIFLLDRTEIMQMAGRRRVKYDDPTDCYTVYLYVPSLEIIESKMMQIRRIQAEVSKCKKNCLHLLRIIKDGADDTAARIRQIFAVTPKGTYEINPLAEDKLYMDYKYYEYIHAIISEYGKEGYCQLIAKLFDREYDDSMEFCSLEERQQMLMDKINTYSFPMSEDDFEDFSMDITDFRIALMGKLPSDNTGIGRKPLKERALNNRFEEVGIPIRIYKENNLYYKKEESYE